MYIFLSINKKYGLICTLISSTDSIIMNKNSTDDSCCEEHGQSNVRSKEFFSIDHLYLYKNGQIRRNASIFTENIFLGIYIFNQIVTWKVNIWFSFQFSIKERKKVNIHLRFISIKSKVSIFNRSKKRRDRPRKANCFTTFLIIAFISNRKSPNGRISKTLDGENSHGLLSTLLFLLISPIDQHSLSHRVDYRFRFSRTMFNWTKYFCISHCRRFYLYDLLYTFINFGESKKINEEICDIEMIYLDVCFNASRSGGCCRACKEKTTSFGN